MTNNINTLNGSLSELGESMANNLITMGVTDAQASDGLTTLANRILDIPVTPVTPTLTLTTDKQILSSYDSDTLTLTATLTGGTVSGQTIEFFNGTTSMGTAQTNSSGVATKIYSSTGVGDVTFSATKGSVASQPITVEDCIYYTTSETECTSSNNYITIADLSSITLPSSFELSMDYKTNYEARCGLFNKSTFTGNPNYSVFIGSPSTTGSTWYYGYRTTSTTTTDVSASATDYHTYTITRNGNSFTYKRDTSGNYSKSISWFNSYNYVIGMMTWGTGKYSYVKNIKLKAL